LLTGAIGAIASVFPFGPVAALLARPAYRRGVRSPIIFGLMGAVIAIVIPLAVYAFGISQLSPDDAALRNSEWVWITLLGGLWFGVSGAVGGIVFARSLHRRDLKRLREAALSF
jgi:hypothetical protein